jgi:lipoprotein-anchoring transpeptidase ErfK/SrfK
MLIHLEMGRILKTYSISSSSYGTGSQQNSFKTPLGKHEIYKKIGVDLPVNAILKGRVWNGAIANVIKEPIDTDFDHVTSRILWLDGLETGKNKGKGVDSRERYIYIHGTAEEGLIGRPASDGCIRMYNNDVIELFDLVEEKAQVWIY